MAIHRSSYLVKILAIVSVAGLLAYGIYRFEVHVMNPSWTKSKTDAELSQIKDSEYKSLQDHDSHHSEEVKQDVVKSLQSTEKSKKNVTHIYKREYKNTKCTRSV